MARIRSIKPEFFTSHTLAKVALPARMTFIGLWSHCDDHGRCLDDERLIKASVWPLDDKATPMKVRQWVDELEAVGLIVFYQGERGERLLAVTNWTEHQRVPHPGPSRFPPPPLMKPPESFMSPPESLSPEQGTGNREVEQGTGNREGFSEEALNLASKYLDPLRSSSPKVFKILTPHIALEIAADEGLSALAAARMLGDVRDWWDRAPPSKRWKFATRGWRNWCRREAERVAKEEPPSQNGQGPQIPHFVGPETDWDWIAENIGFDPRKMEEAHEPGLD